MLLKRLITVLQEPFPALESLHLVIDDNQTGETLPVLPNTFLGGSAPRLRSLHFDRIPFPALPRLLSSSNDLVNLELYRIPHSGYISPEVVATSISSLTRLTRFSIGFESPASRPDPTNRRSPPLIQAIMPALTKLWFHGVSEYLEDLVARVHAPLLHDLQITFFNQLDFDIQQLPRFIGHAPTLLSYKLADVCLSEENIKLYMSEHPFSSLRNLTFRISCRSIDWQISAMAQICDQLSSFMSGIETLNINGHDGLKSTWMMADMDNTQWLELFHPFTAVQTLHMSREELQSLIVLTLRELGGESATEVLPALDDLYLAEFQVSASVREGIEPFIIAREGSAHPVAIHPRER